jgi:hypothetical protein
MVSVDAGKQSDIPNNKLLCNGFINILHSNAGSITFNKAVTKNKTDKGKIKSVALYLRNLRIVFLFRRWSIDKPNNA